MSRINSSYMQSDRYLTLPNSRIVINPYEFEALDPTVTQAQYSNRSNIPLNIGYCDPYIHNSTGIIWKDAMMLYEHSSQTRSVPTITREIDFYTPQSWEIVSGCPDILSSDGGVTIAASTEKEPCIHVIQTHSVCCDINRAILSFKLDRLKPNSKVAIKISNDNWNSNICLLFVKKADFYEIPLQIYTNWSGKQDISFQIHVLDGQGEIAVISQLKVTEVHSSKLSAQQTSFDWEPSCLTTQATFPSGNVTEITDYFPNETTVSRSVSYHCASNLVFAGHFSGTYEYSDNKLRLISDHWYAEIKGPTNITFCFYDTYADFFSETGMSHDPKPTTTIWSAHLGDAANYEFQLSIHSLQTPNPCSKYMSLSERKSFWDKIFEKVPKIEKEKLSSCRFSPDILQRFYLNAWYHIVSNILPPAPETDYPYSCMSTGKASLWAYGDPRCSYAASWETFYGLMLYSEIDPEAAWNMFIGIMNLVDKSGNLGGESLPSVKAQTAWKLYLNAPNIEHLRTIFTPIERYLLWRIDNLRWIYLDKTPNVHQKDIDFVAAALLDIHYFLKICNELSETSKAQVWQKKSKTLYQNMTEWFFANKTLPCQIYDSQTHDRQKGNPLVTLKALRLPLLREQERTQLIEYFTQYADIKKPFWGFQSVKMENMSYLIFGLLQNGKTEEAYKLAKTTACDIAATGFFAEEYQQDTATGKVIPCGVRPSVFGSALFITCLQLF